MLFRCGGGGLERRVGLLVALVQHDAGTGIDDLVALDEHGILLRVSVRVDLDAGQPSRSLEVIDSRTPEISRSPTSA